MRDGSCITYVTTAFNARGKFAANLYDSWECEDSHQHEDALGEIIAAYDHLYTLMETFLNRVDPED